MGSNIRWMAVEGVKDVGAFPVWSIRIDNFAIVSTNELGERQQTSWQLNASNVYLREGLVQFRICNVLSRAAIPIVANMSNSGCLDHPREAQAKRPCRTKSAGRKEQPIGFAIPNLALAHPLDMKSIKSRPKPPPVDELVLLLSS